MSAEARASVEMAPCELGTSLSALRLCASEEQQEMKVSMSQVGQLTAVQAFRTSEGGLEIFDGIKRWRAAHALSWPKLRVEVHALNASGAKVRLLLCNAAAGLTDLEEAWIVRSLYRDDKVDQPHIARLLGHDKSWVCRKLTLAEGLSDELTASVRLGLVSATAAVELARLQRCNQDEAAKVVARRGLTTRQTASLVETLLAAPLEEWPKRFEQAMKPLSPKGPKGGAPRRTPAEQLVADGWAMKRLVVRLHARLLERSVVTYGAAACDVVCHELVDLRDALVALTQTLDAQLNAPGVANATA